MPSIETDLDDVLRSRLTPSHYSTYRRLRERHFYRWKWHRDCEPGSLRGLRYLLYTAGAVAPRASVTVPPTQVFRSYAEEIGFPLEGFTTQAVASGQHSVDDDERVFAEPGDCVLMYEQQRNRQVAHGTGAGLTYALDETLRNSLLPGLRLDGPNRVKAIGYEPLRKMLQHLEVWSTADLVLGLAETAGLANRLAPFDRLAAVTGTELDNDVIAQIQESVVSLSRRHRRATREQGSPAVFAVMLGFLVDELVARVAVPNGVGFWYLYTEAVLTTLQSRWPRLRPAILPLGMDEAGLERDVAQLLADCTATRSPSFDASRTAESLRDIGFALRNALGEDDRDCVFTASNAIWRWVFFAEEQPDDAREVVLRWLRRPWGVVTIDDVRHAYMDLLDNAEPDDDHIPAAFAPVVPMLQAASPQDYLCAALGVCSPARATEVLARFIHCRYVIHRARQGVERVVLSQDPRRELARELILVFCGWASVEGRLPRFHDDLDSLGTSLRSGEWCREMADAGHLSARQLQVLKPYLDNPARTCSQLFRFGTRGFVPAEHLGLMPPERFSLRRPPGHRDAETDHRPL